MEVCRACLTIEEEMVPLNEGFVNAYNLLTSLNITMRDHMPQYVCQSCVQSVTQFLEFREKCISTETSLQDIMQKIKQEDDKPLSELKAASLEIKEEVKDEENSFFNFGEDNFDDEFLPIKNEKVDDTKPKKRKHKKANSKMTKKEKPKPVKIESESLSCGLCNTQCPNYIELSTHIESHKNNESCGLCSIVFKSWPTMVGHRLTHIPQKEYRCHICKRAMWAASGAVSMEYHYMNKHYDGEKTKLLCKICNRGYDTPRKLSKHVNSAHSKKCFICDHCNKTYNNKQRLRSHIKCHSENRSYICELCGFASKHSGGLKDHKIRKHEPAKVKCGDCLRWFATAADRDKHACAIVTKICPICGVQLNMAKNYSRHMRRHSAVKSFKCPRCPAAYRSRSGLTGHLYRHDNIRPLKCPFCPLKFFTPSVLIKHKRVHTGHHCTYSRLQNHLRQPKYAQRLDVRTSLSQPALLRHLYRQDNIRPLKCPYCPLKFFTPSVLIKHKRVHTGEKPYVCKVCNKGFTGNHNLKVHMKVHGEYLVVKRSKPEDAPAAQREPCVI